MLDSKQLKANADKSKFVLIKDLQSRASCLKDAEERSIMFMMGTHKLGNSKAEKYLSDQIS